MASTKWSSATPILEAHRKLNHTCNSSLIIWPDNFTVCCFLILQRCISFRKQVMLKTHASQRKAQSSLQKQNCWKLPLTYPCHHVRICLDRCPPQWWYHFPWSDFWELAEALPAHDSPISFEELHKKLVEYESFSNVPPLNLILPDPCYLHQENSYDHLPNFNLILSVTCSYLQ